MRQKAIVYCLGHDFEMDCDLIHEKYEVIGYCDRNAERSARYGDKQIIRESLSDSLDGDTIVLICSSRDRMDIMHDLILNCAVPMKSIWFFRHLGALDEGKISYIKPVFYGQFYDDGILWGIFTKLGYEMEKVRYLEIGANDPVLSNNTYFFYDKGARGTLIDPLTTSEMLCRRMRPEDEFIRTSVSGTGGGEITLFSGVSAQGTSMHKQFAPGEAVEIKAPLMGINEILSELAYVPDLLVVDAEGEDENIIRAMDYERFRPAVIELEVNKLDDYGNEFIEFMSGKGYCFFANVGSNAIFIEQSKMEKSSKQL